MIDLSISKAILKGLLTYIPFYSKLKRKRTLRSRHSSFNALFCYTFWLQLLKYLDHLKIELPMKTIAELGTGGSLGIGLCALLTKADQYTAMEIESLYSPESNVDLLDELVLLFKNKTKLCSDYTQINLPIVDDMFPEHLVEPMFLDEVWVEHIRSELKTINSRNNTNVRILCPWNLRSDSLFDFVFSRAVMEHVSSPPDVSNALSQILVEGGFVLHDIELHPHGIARSPQSLYSIPNWVWKIIQGRRDYSMNRFTLEQHIASIAPVFTITDIHMSYIQESDGIEEDILNGCTLLMKKKSAY